MNLGQQLVNLGQQLVNLGQQLVNLKRQLVNLGQQLVNLVHYLRSSMLEQKPLANVVLSTVLQSNGIRSLLTCVTFNPSIPMPLKLY